MPIWHMVLGYAFVAVALYGLFGPRNAYDNFQDWKYDEIIKNGYPLNGLI